MNTNKDARWNKPFGFGLKLLCGLAAICAANIGSVVKATAAPAVVTDQGPLKGISTPGENKYLGIPYAAAPVGNLRWLPPRSAAHFKRVFQATQFGSACTQPGLLGAPPRGSEDCLFLNVYTPHQKKNENKHHGLAVMVWIHGGAFVIGAGSDYDPTPLVENGNVIVVTINYRLGLLGFLAHPALDTEGHLNANYGLMDQQFALKWVRRNISVFGGDPKRVTIFGESAGGFSVFSNLASPTAAGLFQGGISESGAYAHFQDYWDPISVVPLVTAETVGTPFVPAGTALAASVGCGSQTAQCLRATSASTLIGVEPSFVFPIIDGSVLTQTLDSAFASGAFNRVPVISGTNHDEWRLFVAGQYDLAGNPLTDAGYPAAVAAFFGLPVLNPFVQLVLGLYPLISYPPPPGYFVSAPLALGALGTDDFFVCTSRNADLSLSKYVPIYTYEFNDKTAPSIFPPLSFPLGDAHFIEIHYFFNSGATFTPDQQQLSNAMIGYWTQFAKTGNPNLVGTPSWPEYGATARFQSLVAPTPAPESDSSFDTDHKCSSFWDTF